MKEKCTRTLSSVEHVQTFLRALRGKYIVYLPDNVGGARLVTDSSAAFPTFSLPTSTFRSPVATRTAGGALRRRRRLLLLLVALVVPASWKEASKDGGNKASEERSQEALTSLEVPSRKRMTTDGVRILDETFDELLVVRTSIFRATSREGAAKNGVGVFDKTLDELLVIRPTVVEVALRGWVNELVESADDLVNSDLRDPTA
jgi:hypothetical protein